MQNAFFLIETTAENSPGIDFDENKYDSNIYIYIWQYYLERDVTTEK